MMTDSAQAIQQAAMSQGFEPQQPPSGEQASDECS